MKKAVFILFPALFVCLCFLMISCGGSDGGDNGNLTDSADNPGDFGGIDENAGDVPAKIVKLEPDLPEADFGGAVINFLVKGEAHHWYWCSKEIYAEQENGEPVNDAVYKRNRYLEGRYNFEITEYRSSNPQSDAQKAVRADDPVYDVFMIGLNTGAEFAQNGYLTNLNSVPNINLSQPWWDQRAVSELSFGDKLYYALGDINTMDNDATFATFFNKKLIADHAMANPYELVRGNEWTLDKFNEMIIEISRDINEDGAMDGNDLFGQLSEYYCSYALFVAAGGRITRNNPDNYPELAIGGEKTSSVIDKILVNMGNRGVTLCADDYTGTYVNPWDELTRPMFKSNQGLFYTIGMGSCREFRDMEADYGILPLPKSDNNQKDYYHFVGTGSCTSVCIPVTNANPERTGHILEAMAAESMYTLTEAYYTINFENKQLRDEDSIEMTKIILKSRSYDIGEIFNFGDFVNMFGNMAKKNQNTFVSEYEKKETSAQKQIDKLTETFNNG